jgi:hypothetical protein
MIEEILCFFRDIPLQEITINPQESTAVVPSEKEQLSDDKRRVSLPHSHETDNPIVRTRGKSVEHIGEQTSSDVPVVLSRKDAVYQGSLHNIPFYNEHTEEYHDQMITTDATTQPVKKKSFLALLGEQVDFKLLKDAAFALFAISNFFTSLGFNIPYNFANDLAGDAKVVADRRHWPLMSIGIANCFGRVIIGLLGDQKWVNTSEYFFVEITSRFPFR